MAKKRAPPWERQKPQKYKKKKLIIIFPYGGTQQELRTGLWSFGGSEKEFEDPGKDKMAGKELPHGNAKSHKNIRRKN